MNHQIQDYRSVIKTSFENFWMLQFTKIISFCFFTRIKKLDKFQFIIIEELENFEKDSQSLKDLEKEFVVCVFKSYTWENC